jgi:flagellar motor component MotA
LREKYLPALIPTLTGIIVGYIICSPQVAGILSTIVAVYIQEQGLDKFCQNCSDS